MKINDLRRKELENGRCRCGARMQGFQDLCNACRSELNDMTRNSRIAKQMASTLYAISIANDPGAAIKFGVTDNVPYRLKTLQTGSPAILEVLATCAGKMAHERKVHRLLIRCRSHGEWFQRTPESLRVVELMKAGTLIEHLGDSRWIKQLQFASDRR